MAIKVKKVPPVDLEVKQTEKVFITVVVGNQQIGGSILQYKGEAEPFEKGRIKDVELGKGSKINGKQLLVETNVLDSNTATDKVVVRHTFKNEKGDEIAKFQYEDEVATHRDILSLQTQYNFKKKS
jgi:hypothetical protein